MGRILPGRSADGARQDVWLHRKRLGGLDVGGLVHAGGMTTTARDQAGRLADLLRREGAEMAEFLLALAEFEKERGWIELGHTSLFHFLHRELGLSKGGVLPEDGGGAGAAVSGDAGAAARWAALHHQRRPRRAGADCGEPARGAAQILPALQ